MDTKHNGKYKDSKGNVFEVYAVVRNREVGEDIVVRQPVKTKKPRKF